MASSQSQRVEVNERRSYRDNKVFHLDVISKSIGRIVTNSKNDDFQNEVAQMLNVKVGQRKKTIQTETMKLLKTNYQDAIQTQKNTQTQRNYSKDQQ